MHWLKFGNKSLLIALSLFLFTASRAATSYYIVVTDTIPLIVEKPVKTNVMDSLQPSLQPEHSPRKATLRSAIIPGWGQIYNKKYWKLPIVYGALGTTGYIFFDNIKFYKRYRYAYRVLATKDSANYANVHADLQPFLSESNMNSFKNARDGARRNIDYSVLFFMGFWLLNIVDATVDAHLKGFDISNDLSLKIKPGYSDFANTNGMSLVLTIGKTKPATPRPLKF